MKTKITFEFENEEKTSVLIKRDGKIIGRFWSEQPGQSCNTPYPHDESTYCLNSIQICGFDRISQTWGCGPFAGKKDCVIHFIPDNEKYYKEKRKQYAEYVKNFFNGKISKIETGIETMNIAEIKCKENKDITSLQSFDHWVSHNI